jgi:hypothetical protein
MKKFGHQRDQRHLANLNIKKSPLLCLPVDVDLLIDVIVGTADGTSGRRGQRSFWVGQSSKFLWWYIYSVVASNPIGRWIPSTLSDAKVNI